MSVIYNNGKPIARCDSYKIEECMGTSDFIKLENFSFLDSYISENQNIILSWMLQETKVVQEYSFQPTGIIKELLCGKKWIPRHLHELWVCMDEKERQQIILQFLLVQNDLILEWRDK